jgi:hypothetical protein
MLLGHWALLVHPAKTGCATGATSNTMPRTETTLANVMTRIMASFESSVLQSHYSGPKG